MLLKKESIEQSHSFELCHEDFLFFKTLIYKLAGISLSEKKRDLVFSRIRSHIKKIKIQSFTEYRNILESNLNDIKEMQTFVNLLTTNKTDFFREPMHFDFLIQELIPLWASQKSKEIKAWSCASSTGEEPYTLSLVLHKHLPKAIPYSILATDIDTNVLNKAQNGVYPISRLSEIPDEYRDLQLGRKSSDGWFRINDDIHKNLSFSQYNLVSEEASIEETYDLILCRNVLIYFSPETTKTLMQKLHRYLKKDAYLLIGHSESIQGLSHLFKVIKPSIFRKI